VDSLERSGNLTKTVTNEYQMELQNPFKRYGGNKFDKLMVLPPGIEPGSAA
jgi:hypothetical protein